MAYYATWVPIVDHWIVSASDEDGSMLGFLDVALGAFPATRNWAEGVYEILLSDWKRWADARQPEWEELTSRGVLDAEVIYAAAEAAWPSADESEDEQLDE